MSRYIDADKLSEKLDEFQKDVPLVAMAFARGQINAAPTADVVEVCRCKDCKHCEQSYLYKEKGKESKLEYICCAFGNVSPDFYCGIGERREE